jgi:RNA polymerase sigma-70 factor (sigma-E family)
VTSRRERREAAYVDYVAARQGYLRRIAYALCGDWHQSEDLLQTALAKLYVAWPRVHRDGREDAYVRQILVRTNIDAHRRARSRELPGVEGLERAMPDPTTAVADRTELFEALQRLPQMQRKVVLLRHWLDLSVDQIAAELGIGPGTVKSHTSRGIAALQAALTGPTRESTSRGP